MKKLFIQTLLLLCSILCIAKSHKTNFLVIDKGDTISIKSFSRIQGDTVVFSVDSALTFIPVNSIIAYHTSGGTRAGTGLLVGALTGMVIGYLIGNTDESLGSEALGIEVGFICMIPGALIGAAIGNSVSKDDIVVDFKKYKIEERKRLIILFVEYYKREQGIDK